MVLLENSRGRTSPSPALASACILSNLFRASPANMGGSNLCVHDLRLLAGPYSMVIEGVQKLTILGLTGREIRP